MSTYALQSYSYTSSLCWGNCFGHLQKVCEESSWCDRIVHLAIAIAELLPIISQIISLFEQFVVGCCCAASAAVPSSTEVIEEPLGHPASIDIQMPEGLRQIINDAPDFNEYMITLPNRTQSSLLLRKVRPANLFFKAIGVPVTMPNRSGDPLFAISNNHTAIRRYLESRVHETVDITASGKLARVYGDRHYRISFQEVVDTLNSQEICLSPLVPLDFYRGLKAAMLQDGMVEVPKTKLRDYRTGSTGAFLQQHRDNSILNYTFYELGTQIVKIEDYRIFVDERVQLLERGAGANDALRLINMCGIRPNDDEPIPLTSSGSHNLMSNAFRTALAAANNGIIIFPAVGIEGRDGDPELYWKAFFYALVSSPEMNDALEYVCVNPGLEESTRKFLELLAFYKTRYQGDQDKLAKLNKVIYLPKQDILQLAHRLKLAYSDKTISVVNASDPDVTLGNHVGEYVNTRIEMFTTEENFTAMGTNGLCFETLTNIHTDRSRQRIHALNWQ